MGCCASIASDFRDVYVQMLKTFELIPKSNDFTTYPKEIDMNKRSRRFESLCHVRAALASKSTNPFECNPTEVDLPSFLGHSESFWKLNTVHPYNGLLTRETVVALNFIRSVKEHKDISKLRRVSMAPQARRGTEWEVFRWDFRLWMIAMCEFYHVLAILVESKSVPMSAGKWFHNIESKDKKFFQLNSKGDLSEEARRAIEESDDLMITKKDLTSNLITGLEREMATVFTCKNGPGGGAIAKKTNAIYEATAMYWREKREVLMDYIPPSRQGQAKKRLQEDKKLGDKAAVPLICLAEWITMRYVRSLCSKEEIQNAYLPSYRSTENLDCRLFDSEFMAAIPGLTHMAKDLEDTRRQVEAEQAFARKSIYLELEDLIWRTQFEPEEHIARELMEAEINKEKFLADCKEEEGQARKKIEEEEQAGRKQLEESANKERQVQKILEVLIAQEEKEREAIIDEEATTWEHLREKEQQKDADEMGQNVDNNGDELIEFLEARKALMRQMEEEEAAVRKVIEDAEEEDRRKFSDIADALKKVMEEQQEGLQKLEEEEVAARNKITEEEAAAREQLHLDAAKSLEEAKEREKERLKRELEERKKECRGNLDMWRKLVRRIDDIDERLTHDKMPATEKEPLLVEKKDIEGNLTDLYRRLSHQHEELTNGECRSGLYEELGLCSLFPDRTFCDTTSDKAFSVALKNTNQTAIHDLTHFRTFMRTYVTLIDLFGDTADEEGRRWEEGVLALDEMVNTAVLVKSHERGDILNDPDFFEQSTLSGIIASVFHKGTHECPDNIDQIEFPDLVSILLRNQPDASGKYTLFALKELKEKIGAGGNKKKQTEFIQKFLAALPENLKNTENSEEMEQGKELSAEKIAEVVKLKLYSRFNQSPARVAMDFCSTAVYCTGNEHTPFQKYLTMVMESQKPSDDEETSPVASIVPFSSMAVYTATAVVRSFEDTRHNELERMSFQTWQTPVSFEWFLAGLAETSRALDTPAEELATNALAYLRANNVKGGFVEPTEEETKISNPISRAFHVIEQMGIANGSTGARVQDIVQMCLFAEMKKEFENDPLFKDFFKYAFNEGYILPKDRRSTKYADFRTPEDAAKKINDILFAGKSEMDLYTEFFSLSLGVRSIPMTEEGTIQLDEEHKMNLEEFLNNFMAKYMEELEMFLIQDKDRLLFEEAAAYITLEVPFTARRYRNFLNYISGYTTSTVMYSIKYSADTDHLGDTALLANPIPLEFVEFLVQMTDDEFQTPKTETAQKIFEGLSGKDFASLATAAGWYATYRVERYPPTHYDQWEKLGPTIPYSCSFKHRMDRRPMIMALKKRAAQLAMEERGNQDGCEDLYFPIAAIGEVLTEKFDMGIVAASLRCSTAMKRKEGGIEPDANHVESFRKWLEEHVAMNVNEAAGRPDLGKDEIHWTGIRFVLQYIHHCMEAFFLSEEVCKEVEAMIKADVGPSGRPPNLSAFMKKKMAQSSLYVDAEHVEATEKAVEQLHAPATEIEGIQKEMVKLANSTIGEDETKTLADISRENCALVDPEQVGHVIASRLLKYTIGVYFKALDEFKERIEEQLTNEFEAALLSGNRLTEAFKQMASVATYWERLRFLLPHRHNEQHRKRRRRLYQMMDRKGKGYLSVPDLQFGSSDVLHLYMFREDTLPVLFRSFFGVKEHAFSRKDVVYLTGGAEQIVSPPEFLGYLEYFYRYMEIYFMFDVLTAAGRVQNDLHVQPGYHCTASSVCRLPPMNRVDSTGRAYTPSTALRAATDNPHQLTMECTTTSKVVNIHQFKLAKYLLRNWGCAVKDVEELFRKINRRCAELGELQFTDFAIWASQIGLRPEGYGHRCDDGSDALAGIEERLLKEGLGKAEELMPEKRTEDGPAPMKEDDLIPEYV